ncbi:uncharacterized protein LOC123670711 isoform X1 [Harmonia axyridis]|uniref:uncharacterized protein LOC123670711 isoform X1 n=1 Tax=Harmonia axyridis TaxID=115357 RepID=UPI001E279981|nr:uncharacterized protein LOC123670711 isoform X1 [Harmonia axyridis]
MPYLTLIHFNAIFLLSSFQISGSEPSTSQQQPTSQQQTESITPRKRYEERNDRRRYTPEGSEYLSQRLRNLRRASRISNRNLLQTLVKIAQESNLGEDNLCWDMTTAYVCSPTCVVHGKTPSRQEMRFENQRRAFVLEMRKRREDRARRAAAARRFAEDCDEIDRMLENLSISSNIAGITSKLNSFKFSEE